MKKYAYVLLITLICMLTFPPTNALAASASVTVKAAVDNYSKIVIISGTISSGQDQQVTVKVLNSIGAVDFLGQTVSGSGGNYSFAYKLDKSDSGYYTVFVGGTAVSATANTTFTYFSPTSTPTPTPTPKGTDTVTSGNVTIDPKNVVVNGDKATVEVTMDSINKAIANSNTLTIKIPEIQGVKKVSAKLPANILVAAKEKGMASIKVDTGLATISLTIDALKDKITENAKSIEISVAKVDKTALSADVAQKVGDSTVYDFNIYVDGNQVSKFTGKKAVEVSVNYTLKPEENPDKIVIYYINDNGKLEAVRNSAYDAATGKVSFTTNHFSKYVAMQTDVTFSDIANVAWAKIYIEALAGRGIIDGMEEGKFIPEGQLTRAQYIKLLMYAFDLVDETDTTSFTDVKVGDWYYASVASAQKLGIVQGMENNRFGADILISRQDMAAMIFRTAQVAGVTIAKAKDAQNFSDTSSIAGYAAESVNTMQQAGIIDGTDNNRFAPEDNATRAQAAKIIYLVYKQQ